MCLIAYLKNKSFVDYDALESAHENNPHGWGIVYAQDGRLHACKKHASFAVFKDAMELVPDDVPISIHFRWATHGDKSENNIHPFDVLTFEDDGVDVAMMHNGVISGTGVLGESGDKRSDTALYVEYVIRPMFKENPKLMYNTGFQTMVSRDIGYSNKFLFMDGKGGVIIINPNSGHFPIKDSIDIWYSNTYSLTSSYRSKKVGKETYDSSLHGHGYSDWYANNNYKKDTTTKHVVPANTSVSQNSVGWAKNPVTGIFERRERIWHNPDTHETTKYGGRYTNHKPFPETLSGFETDLPIEINNFLKNGEKLLKPVRSDGVMLGFGWATTPDNMVSRWDNELCTLHKAWYNQQIEDQKNKQKQAVEEAIADIAPHLESKFDASDFRKLSITETLDWVDKHPRHAAEWVVKHGFFGAADSIEQFIISGEGWEEVSDFIFARSRNAHCDTVTFQKSLDKYAQRELFTKNSHVG
jgi:predicted glutamine amidotransferase